MTSHQPYQVRHARRDDLPGARALMLDTFYREFGYGYVPAWHEDVVALEATYLDHPRHALIVATGPDGEVVGSTALHSRGPAHPPHPQWLAERYPSGLTAQLVRVYVRAGHRRHGLARRMVALATEFAGREGGYQHLYLHTNVDIAGAEPFWRSLAVEVCDARTTGEHGPGVATVHFEIPLGPGRPNLRLPGELAGAQT
ncbi:acetyltransferase [Kitasatospora sp. Root187]|uniref:GNAT family N-acetyltransferase n=1 Tax=Kitasatospora sp. Root187 TaxID=1736486 RepID=UPI00070D4390|nr:GNAT family N-acetyltransferase [Kitasatospora sp. Root187]KRB61033.1 acetyltransferase [Kitasatospora sp. Root187]